MALNINHFATQVKTGVVPPVICAELGQSLCRKGRTKHRKRIKMEHHCFLCHMLLFYLSNGNIVINYFVMYSVLIERDLFLGILLFGRT